MKRILFVAAAVASFNVFGALENSQNVGVTVQANLQEAARGNVEGTVSYDNLLNNKVSVVVSGAYNPGTETGESVSNAYAKTYASKAPYTVDRQVKGFSAGVAGNYFLNTNTESSAFAGVKLSFANGEFTNYETTEVKNTVTVDGKKKEETTSVTDKVKENRKALVVRATVPVGYQWVSGQVVVSTSAELGASYDTDAKENAFRPHVEANLLSVGMKF